MIVKLSPEECHMAVLIASTRQTSSAIKGLKDRINDKSWFDGFLVHFHGCVGEIAAAKALDVHWPGWVDRFTTVADLGDNIEVRHRVDNAHDLIIRNSDDKDKFYVLTTGLPDAVIVHGYIRGKNGMNKTFIRTHGGKPAAYFVPKEFLSPIEQLKQKVHNYVEPLDVTKLIDEVRK